MTLRYPGSYGSFRGVIEDTPAVRQLYTGAFRRMDFGAESFAAEGRECSVRDIEAAGGDTWRNFCDCAFSTPLPDPYWHYNGAPLVPPPGMGISSTTWVNSLKDTIPNYDPKKLELKPLAGAIKRDPNWYKCLSKWCGAATGCWNPSKKDAGTPDNESWDGFNVHPGMWFAPWTEVGAAARGIPKRNAGAVYGLTALTTINIADYNPARLLVLSIIDPVRYAVLVGFASAFGVGLLLANQATLIEAALIAAPISERAEPGWILHNVVMPLWEKARGIAMMFIGLVTGGIPGAVAAMLQANARMMVVEYGVDVSSPVNAVILAFANDAPKIKALFDPTLWTAPSTWGGLGDVIFDVGKLFDAEPIMLAGQALGLVANTIQALQQGTADDALDVLCNGILGFKLSAFQNAMKEGPDFTRRFIQVNKPAKDVLLKNFAKAGAIIGAMRAVADALAKFTDILSILSFGLTNDIRDKMHQVDDLLTAVAAAAKQADTYTAPTSPVIPTVAPVAKLVASSSTAASTGGGAAIARMQAGGGPASSGQQLAPGSATRPTAIVPTKGGGTGLLLAGAAAWLLL